MNGKLKLIKDGQESTETAILSIIMTEEEKNYFVAGCDAIGDGFCRQLKERVNRYEPEDEEEDELAKDGPLFNFLVRDCEVFEYLIALFGYIAVYGVDEIHAGDYNGIIETLRREVARLKEELKLWGKEEKGAITARANCKKNCIS